MSSFDGNLKDFLEQLTVISELTKEARTQISEFLKKGDSDEVTKIDIRDKLSNFTNTLNEETAKTQKKYSNLSKSILDALNKSKEAVSSESIPEENGNEVTDHIEKTYSMEENGENESKSEEKTEIKKPMLKIVDFSKLVDPRNLELMDKNHERKQRNQDSSVIILSSSDDESISAIKSNSQKSNKIEPQKLKSKNNLKVQKLSKNPVIYRTLSASKTKEPSIHLQKPKQNPETNRLRRISIDEEYKNDEKFRRRAYVNLLRIPCEQMKTYYLQNIHQKSNSKASSSSKSRDANESLERILDEKTGELVSNSAHSSNDECESRNLKNQDSSEDGEVPLISICKNKEKGVISENSPDKNLQNKRENETQSKNKKKVVEEKRNEESENEQVRRNLATKKLSEDISGSSCSEEEILKNQKKILEKRSKRNRNKKDTVSDSSDYEHSIIKKTRNNRNRNKKDVISNSSDEKSKTEIGKRKKDTNSNDETLGNKIKKGGKRKNISKREHDCTISSDDEKDTKNERKKATENCSSHSKNESRIKKPSSSNEGADSTSDERPLCSKSKNAEVIEGNEDGKKIDEMKNSSNEEKDNTSKNNEIKSNLDKDEENESVKLDKDSSEVNTENLVEKEKSIEENDEISKKKSIHEKTNSQICESDKTSSDETKIESSKKVHEDESEKNTSQSGEEGTSGKKKLFSNKATEEYSLEEMGGDCNMDKEKDSSKETTKNTHDESYVLSDSEKDEPRKKKLAENSSESDSEKKRKRGKKKIDEDVITINSEDSNDSDDFSTFCVKKKLIRNAKKEIKKIISESESEENEKSEGNEKSENSDAEYEDQKSDGESSDSSSKTEKEKQDRPSKRRRIKQVNDDSSGSDSKVTRKKIKKVISKNSLSDETKKAEAEERERRQRIFEKQKKYNQIYENADLASSKVDKLILDIDEKTEKPLLEVGKDLVSKLKPHQASGIQFMWDACFESLEMAKSNEGSGCILAHCMGLGKTLQVIALATTLLESAEETNVRKVLIVTPLSTVLNWKSEFNNWLSGDEDFEVYELVTCKTQNAERAHYIKQWHQNGGVMIISYAMFRNLSNDKNKKVSKKLRTTFYEGLVDPGPDLVVCDEGHLLKNEKTGLSIAMNKIKTRRRIVLTGTPLQNNLKEYYCMVQFVKPSLLGTYKEYLNRFVNPITNGQYTDSTQYDINIMRRRSHVLHKLLEGIVQRRDYSVLSPYLPPKHEYVLFLTLTDTQKKLYSHYLNHFARKSKEGSNRTSYLFQDFQAFSRICIHPRVLLDKSAEDQQKYKSDDEESIGSLKDFICDESDTTTPECSESESNSEESDKNKKKSVSRRVTRAQRADKKSGSESEVEEVQESEKEWWQEFCDGEELDNIAHGTKILMLLEILKECEQIGDKVLVFSQSLYALNVIEYFLAKVDEATQNGNANEKTCGYTGSWAFGLDYFRLDGSTNCNTRSTWCDNFNKESNTRARLFLLSTRAGGLGINLVAANRVIIFDVSWNPSSDIQSIYRVYRFGQLKPSYIYRFVIYGTMEMKIYERQVTKQAISKRVIDEQQIDRHYNQNDLAELYKFEPGSEDRPIPLVPKDVLLGELLQHHEDKIFKYHEHQSLLENKEDETLNEEERKAAWEEFENEKVARTKQNLIGKFSVNTVQLALKSIIQRDNPTWNNNQILSIIPQLMEQLIFQLNANDTTMYNKIATEVKHMQDEYARKMQMQFMQYRMQMEAQRRQQQFGPQHLNAYARFPNPYLTGQFQQYFMGTPANAFGASTSNSNDVVELN